MMGGALSKNSTLARSIQFVRLSDSQVSFAPLIEVVDSSASPQAFSVGPSDAFCGFGSNYYSIVCCASDRADVVCDILRTPSSGVEQRDLRGPGAVADVETLAALVTRALNESGGFVSGLTAVLRTICCATGWSVGLAWTRRMADHAFECRAGWSETVELERFRAESSRMRFEHAVLERAWQTQVETWCEDVAKDASFRRGPLAASLDLRAGCFIPVVANGGVVAVLELFAKTGLGGQEAAARAVAQVVSQIGPALEHKRGAESLALLEAVVAQMDEAIVLSTAGTPMPTIVYVNDAFARATGYGKQELLGRSLRVLFDRDVDPSKANAIMRALETGATIRCEHTNYTSDHSAVRLEWRGSPVHDPDTGQTTHCAIVLRDVTRERVESESRARLARSLKRAADEWRRTFDAIDAPVLIVDRKGQVRRLNRRARAMLDATSSVTLGLAVGNLGQGEPWTTAAALVDEMGDHPAGSRRQVDDAVTGRTWDISLHPLMHHEPGGSDERVLVIAREITDVVELQRSLRKTETMAAMGAIVGGVAHEVRNPLFGISATLDALGKRFKDNPVYQPYTRVLRREVARLSELMRDLLEYGRPRGLSPSMTSIGEVIATAVRTTSQHAAEACVRIHVNVEDGLPETALDAGRIAQVFQNLIENAIQHSPKNGLIEITATRRREAASEIIVCTVADSGPGFGPEEMHRLFEPFFTRRRGGTGLGLSIVQRILEQHGASIAAVNRASGGASISVEFPVRTLAAAKEAHS
jgi:PAS domain S-box-containing protein